MTIEKDMAKARKIKKDHGFEKYVVTWFEPSYGRQSSDDVMDRKHAIMLRNKIRKDGFRANIREVW